ncbi:MAG TPA: tetratricopeptide repeat protein [Aggregatilinea sp.]|uniref:tetratricopeptide repeat protein n=1 Tax=Aggregatilinea sp. TaxID=2806333 RepID=UPI002C08A8CC|nr:tetratricopeptide repeat protein [Aggregatilinea sp.]HML22533.1 tetratricopeptide repeat protein [Aggregatilinea sp.]
MADQDIQSTSGQPEKQPMNGEAFRRMMRQAAYLLTHGSGREAIPLLEECLDFHPDDVNVLTNLAGAYILAERHRHAVPLMERATELAPDNPAVWSNLGAAYLGKLITANAERQARALEAYSRAVELDPSYPNVHYNMGLIHIDRREWEQAYDAFTRALQSNPHDQDAHNMRRRVDELRSQPTDTATDD